MLKKKKGMAEYITKKKNNKVLLTRPFRNSPGQSPLQEFPLPFNIMGSSLASVIIVNVRLCRDAFKGRFREEVCTYFGGACESEFVTVVWLHVHWCTK